MMNKFPVGFATYMLLGIFLSSPLPGRMLKAIIMRNPLSSSSKKGTITTPQQLQEQLEICAHRLGAAMSNLFPTTTKNNNNSKNDQPASISFTKSASICTIQKDGLYYIDEWVDYHLALGFETIYIYDNSDDFELRKWAESRNRNQVVVIHFPGPRQQKPAIRHCVIEHKNAPQEKHHEWLAILDIDEFIVLKKHDTILEMLHDVVPSSSAGLAVNRVSFYFSEEDDTSNQTSFSSSLLSSSNYHYEPLPVTKRFPMRIEAIDRYFKTIARVQTILRPNVHGHDYFRQWKAIDTNGENVTVVPSQKDPTGTDTVVVIHHYQTKSLQEFRSKCQRGDAVHGTLFRDNDDGDGDASLHKNAMTAAPAANMTIKGNQEACLPESKIIEKYGKKAGKRVFDDSAWRFLQKAVPSYQRYNIPITT